MGLILAVSCLGLFFRFFTQNLPESTDIAWLRRIKHVLAAEDQYPPEIGKYNPGQKFVFWSQFVLIGVLHQVHDHLLEPLADDVATLGLDMLLAEEGWRRGGENPFLLGY